MRSPNDGGDWGILGGAFNPVHYGHLTLARDICSVKRSDGVLLVPSYNPPRKPLSDLAPYEDRLAMLRLAIADEKQLVIDTIESELDTPGYTLLTIRGLKKRYPLARFYFIIGSDLLAEFETWYEAHEILQEVRVVVGSRPGAQTKLPKSLPSDQFEVIDTSMVDVASRDIRQQVRNGTTIEALSRLVPLPVARYIFERKLYRE